MAGIEGEGPRGEPTPPQRPLTEQRKPQMEAGNGSPGLPTPSTIHERAKPPPKSPAHESRHSTSVQQSQQESQESNALASRSQEQSIPGEMSDLVLNSVLREWSAKEEFNKKFEIFREITQGKKFRAGETAQLIRAARASGLIGEPEVLTPEAEERQVEEEIARLRAMQTMRERVKYTLFELIPAVWDKLQKRDPELTAPISARLEKRQARIEKGERLIERIYQRHRHQGER